MKNLIAKAKAALIIDQPFFATILLGMLMTADESVKTMATDGESIRYNPQWTESLTLAELIFVLAHETLHCVFQHMSRRGEKNHNRWNIAADYVINESLVKGKIGSMPKGGLQDSKLFSQGGGTADGIYKILPKETEQKNAGSKGGALDDIFDAGSNIKTNGAPRPDKSGHVGSPKIDSATKSEREADIRVRVIQARDAAKMQGKLSAELERLVNDLVKVKTDWRAVLRRFITEKCKSEVSYARPKRRFLAEDLYLPSHTGEKLGAIAVAIDCSGSIRQATLNQFSAEINVIIEDTRPSEIKIIYFDAKVLRIDTLKPDEPVKLSLIGGGGTMFSPVFRAINELESAPIACVFLTDLICDDFGPMPDYPVLWASTESDSDAPFGEIIEIGDDQ